MSNSRGHKTSIFFKNKPFILHPWIRLIDTNTNTKEQQICPIVSIQKRALKLFWVLRNGKNVVVFFFFRFCPQAQGNIYKLHRRIIFLRECHNFVLYVLNGESEMVGPCIAQTVQFLPNGSEKKQMGWSMQQACLELCGLVNILSVSRSSSREVIFPKRSFQLMLKSLPFTTKRRLEQLLQFSGFLFCEQFEKSQ